MEQSKSTFHDKSVWEDLRDTVRGGLKDFQAMGDEIARQGRLRMDVVQTERRLRCAHEALGEAVFIRLTQRQSLVSDDPAISELTGRIRYYMDELNRLKTEQHKAAEHAS
jgi:hypothetical protein